jgi:hypothetical protein
MADQTKAIARDAEDTTLENMGYQHGNKAPEAERPAEVLQRLTDG